MIYDLTQSRPCAKQIEGHPQCQAEQYRPHSRQCCVDKYVLCITYLVRQVTFGWKALSMSL